MSKATRETMDEMTARINELNRKIFCTPDRYFLHHWWWSWRRTRLIMRRSQLRRGLR